MLPHVGVKYKLNVHFYSFIISSNRPHSPTAGPIFVLDDSNDVVWRNDVPFVGRIDQNLYLGGHLPQKHPKDPGD